MIALLTLLGQISQLLGSVDHIHQFSGGSIIQVVVLHCSIPNCIQALIALFIFFIIVDMICIIVLETADHTFIPMAFTICRPNIFQLMLGIILYHSAALTLIPVARFV